MSDYWFWYKWIMIVVADYYLLKIVTVNVAIFSNDQIRNKKSVATKLTLGGIFKIYQNAVGIAIVLLVWDIMWRIVFWVF